MYTIYIFNYFWSMIAEKETEIFDGMPMGRLMAALTKKYYGALSKKIEPLGIDRHFATLVTIDNTKEKCTQQYLSNIMKFDKVSMVRILDYLFEKGMVTRSVNPEDRREHLIQLTVKAKKIMPKIKGEITSMNNTALNGLNRSEQEQFKGFIKIITKNLENLPVNKVDIKIKKR